jgi:N-acetylneuraminate synthase
MPKHSPEVTIAGRKIGALYPPYIVAEISGNHLRDKKRAKLLFSEAKRAGVDAVKIQTYTPDSLAIEIAPEKIASKPQWREAWGWNTGDIYNLYKQVYTPQGEFTEYLFRLGKEFDLTLFSTPFSVEDATYLAKNFDPPAYKIGALEYNFFPLLEVVARTKKPLFINVCLATLEQINATLSFLQKAKSGPVVLLTGPKIYHADAAKNFLLGRLHALEEKFSQTHVLGLSDHFLRGEYNGTYYQGHEFSVAGILQYGASYIEKHFCGCRSGLPAGPRGDVDGTASLVTEEMQAHVFWARLAHQKRQGEKLATDAEAELQLIQRKAAYGYGEKMIGPTQAEIDANEAGATRFIYAKQNIPANHPLQMEELHFSRAIHHAHPEAKTKTFLPTSTLSQVLGNSLRHPLEKGDPIFAESLINPVDLTLIYEPTPGR